MKRVIVVILLALTILLAVYFFNNYWIHRYDALIRTQAAIYRVDPDLVWSILYNLHLHSRKSKGEIWRK